MRELQDRIAVITGGGSGIGRAIALEAAARGMHVAVLDVELAEAEKVAAEVRDRGRRSLAIGCDVSDRAAVEAAAERTYAELGACHLLCNNAGVLVLGPLDERSDDDWRWALGVNLFGVIHGVQAFVPRMIESGEEGFIMNTSSGDGGIAPLAEQVVYASSKAAVSILTECLAAQLAGRETNLRAAIFYPSGGMLKTGIWTTKRNRPSELSREKPVPEGSETTFDEFMASMKKVGIDLPVQDLDELAVATLEGIKAGDFVIMVGREQMEAQLVDRARKLARGECPTALIPTLS